MFTMLPFASYHSTCLEELETLTGITCTALLFCWVLSMGLSTSKRPCNEMSSKFVAELLLNHNQLASDCPPMSYGIEPYRGDVTYGVHQIHSAHHTLALHLIHVPLPPTNLFQASVTPDSNHLTHLFLMVRQTQCFTQAKFKT